MTKSKAKPTKKPAAALVPVRSAAEATAGKIGPARTVEPTLVERVADAAHQRGLDARDLPQLPGVLKQFDLNAADISPAIAHQANKLNHDLTEAMIDKFNGEGTPAILAPTNEPLHLLAARLAVEVVPGLQLVGFLRWAGKQGWNEFTVQKVLEFLGVIAPAWLYGKQLEYGKSGWAVPPLDDEQEDMLFEALGMV